MNTIQSFIARLCGIQGRYIDLQLENHQQKALISQLQKNISEIRDNEKRLYEYSNRLENEFEDYKRAAANTQAQTLAQLREVEAERLELAKKIEKLANADSQITELKAKIAGLHARIGGLTKAANKNNNKS